MAVSSITVPMDRSCATARPAVAAPATMPGAAQAVSANKDRSVKERVHFVLNSAQRHVRCAPVDRIACANILPTTSHSYFDIICMPGVDDIRGKPPGNHRHDVETRVEAGKGPVILDQGRLALGVGKAIPGSDIRRHQARCPRAGCRPRCRPRSWLLMPSRLRARDAHTGPAFRSRVPPRSQPAAGSVTPGAGGASESSDNMSSPMLAATFAADTLTSPRARCA